VGSEVAVAVVWLVLGVVLLAVELHHFAFYALFGTLAAFAAALVALVAPSAVPLQVAVFVAVTSAGVVLIRPYVSRAFAHRREGTVARGVHGGLVGAEVVALDAIGDEHAPGHVRLAGERWLAVSGSGHVLPAGTDVEVTAVRGTTLLVWPRLGPAAAVVLGEPGAAGDGPAPLAYAAGGDNTPSAPAPAPDGAEAATPAPDGAEGATS
jgi:membrane protein implicated in regulation of membrane protease activity